MNMKYFKKNGRILPFLLIFVLLICMLPTSLLNVYALPLSVFTVEIDSTIEGAVSVVLTNSAEPDEMQTETVTDGKATFEDFVDQGNNYDIQITGMKRYVDFQADRLQFRGTSIIFHATDFTEKTFSIKTSALGNGTISTDEDDINYGDSKVITATADEGYIIERFKVNNIPVWEAAGQEHFQYDIMNIQSDYQVDVTFVEKKWEVTFTIDGNGIIKNDLGNSIENGGKITAGESDDIHFTATANENYHVSEVVIDSITQTDGTFDNAQKTYSPVYPLTYNGKNRLVKVVFAIDTYEVTVDKGDHGSVLYDGEEVGSSISAAYDSAPSFEITPEPGYQFSVFIDHIPVADYQNISANNVKITYKMDGVKKNQELAIIFDQIPTVSGHIKDYFDINFSKDYIRMEETAATITYFLPYDGEAALVPADKKNGISYHNKIYKKTPIINQTTYIDKDNGLMIAEEFKLLFNSLWRNPLRIQLPKSIFLVIDTDEPEVEAIQEQDWTNAALRIYGKVTDADTAENPSSGLLKVVWSKGTELTAEEVRRETTNAVTLSGPEWNFTVSGEHDSIIYYVYAVDQAGNVSKAKTVNVKIDVIPPEITEFNFRKIEPPVVAKDINFLSFGTFYSEEIEVIVSAKDTGVTSGLKEMTLFSDGAEVESKAVSGGSATFTLKLTDFNDHMISAFVKDKAGNQSDKSKPTDLNIKSNAKSDRVVLKTEKPTISIMPTSVAGYVNGEENWYNGNVGFDVHIETESVGIHSVIIKVNGQEVVTDKNDKAINANFYESLTLEEDFLINTDFNPRDGQNIIEVVVANNCTMEATGSNEVYIDTTNPRVAAFHIDKEHENTSGKVPGLLTFGNFYNEKVKITVVGDDRFGATSGIAGITLYANGVPVSDALDSVTLNEDKTFTADFILPKDIIPNRKLLDVVLTAAVTDNVGNITGMDALHPKGRPVNPTAVAADLSSDRLVIETINPEITITTPNAVYIDGKNRKWYSGETLFDVTVHDADAGIHSIQIKLNHVEILKDIDGKAIDRKFYNTETHQETFRINSSQTGWAQDGSCQIEVSVMDNAGNLYTANDIVYKDQANPTITGYRFIPDTSDKISETTKFIKHLEYGFYFKKAFTVVVDVADKKPSSGLDRVQYSLVSYKNGKKIRKITRTKTITGGTARIAVPKGFKGRIFVQAFDNTKNESEKRTSQGFVSDNAKPEISVANNNSTAYRDADGNKLYVSDMSFTATVSDYDSGLREIGYYKSAEKNPYGRKSIRIKNTGNKVGDNLGDGWTIEEMDRNLVTKATKTFTFSDDENNLALTFDVIDCSGNHQKNIRTERVTIDKTDPVINVVFRGGDDEDLYYKQNRIADVTVMERNFNAEAIKVEIENTFGSVPDFGFTEISSSEHTAVIEFGQGDYTFDVSGMDLGGHEAAVHFSGGNERLFYVDKTAPAVEENFIALEKENPSFLDKNNSFKEDKSVKIKITEHHFDPSSVHLVVLRKEGGSEHSLEEMVDATSEVVGGARWKDSGDVHTLSFKIDRDAVYRIEIAPTDLAGNTANPRNSVIFEIDKTVPVVKQRNGAWVSEDDTEFLDIYPYSRKDDPAPTVEFEDINIDHLEYDLTVYIPDHTYAHAETVIRPVKVYLEQDKDKSGNIAGNRFTLPDFVKDGLYAVELTAVDVAGNKSLLNYNTYARLIEQDVLAYILDSNVTAKTGLYSFQYENGEAISKRPDNFSDLKLFVLAPQNTDIDIVLRDNNADEVNTYAQATVDSSQYGFEICNFDLKSSFFKEKFQDDTDVEMHLTVKNEGSRIDLGTMHIDNIAPACEVPEEFNSWNWFYGEEERTIKISNISELIDENQCKVYDNGKEIEFHYLSEESAMTFVLGKGWHNVGVTIGDIAGNATNIQEKSNMYIGFFWLWVIISTAITLTIVIAFIMIQYARRKHRLEND